MFKCGKENDSLVRNERLFESIITCAPYGVPILRDEVKNADARPAWGPGLMHASETRTLRI